MDTRLEWRGRRLLATTTSEAFQPVHIYYVVPDRPFVVARLEKLECMLEAPSEGCWQWLFDAEAASLRFAERGYDDVPKEKRPIIIGRIRFPKERGMTLESDSFDRAIAGAHFFASRLGPDVVAMRCRVVNRCFAAEEGQPRELMATLDRDVTVIDPRETEAFLRRAFERVRPGHDPKRAVAEILQQSVDAMDDVPMVEDFPLAPEEETGDFQHLENTLRFRFIRAFEHWRGNTHLTLKAIIARTVGASARAPGGQEARS